MTLPSGVGSEGAIFKFSCLSAELSKPSTHTFSYIEQNITFP